MKARITSMVSTTFMNTGLHTFVTEKEIYLLLNV